MDYEHFKAALLQRYNYTEQGYRQHFREIKPEGAENPDQFIVRLRNHFTQRVKLFEVESSFEGVVESSSSSSFEGYPLQVRHKQDWGRGFILLLPQIAELPGSDAGSGVIQPALSFVIQNC